MFAFHFDAVDASAGSMGLEEEGSKTFATQFSFQSHEYGSWGISLPELSLDRNQWTVITVTEAFADEPCGKSTLRPTIHIPHGKRKKSTAGDPVRGKAHLASAVGSSSTAPPVHATLRRQDAAPAPPWPLRRRRRPSPPRVLHCRLAPSVEELARSPALRASFQLAAPPCVSHLLVPAHFVAPRPLPDRDGDVMPLVGGGVRAASEDGLLLLDFMDGSATAPIVHKHGTFQARRVRGFNMDPDITRLVANPLSGQLVRLPDIDGTKKTVSCKFLEFKSQPAPAIRKPYDQGSSYSTISNS
ncbi:hypothetical protein EJB05_35916, partial [Eragrostis curvula]